MGYRCSVLGHRGPAALCVGVQGYPGSAPLPEQDLATGSSVLRVSPARGWSRGLICPCTAHRGNKSWLRGACPEIGELPGPEHRKTIDVRIKDLFTCQGNSYTELREKEKADKAKEQ